MLLAPGFMTDADLWRDMEGELAAFGPLAHVDTSRDASIEAMAQRALHGAPSSFVMVGFSMGGYVAREITRQGQGRISALVLIATSARGDTPEQGRRKAIHAKQVAQQGFAGLSRWSIVASLHPSHVGDTGLIERIQAMATRLGGEVFQRQCELPRHGDLDRLHDIQCPTLILAGEADTIRSKAETDELHAGISGSKIAMIEGTGHMLPLEAPKRVAQTIVSWLKH